MSQIFCKHIDIQILYDLFERISYKKNGCYLIDQNAYKKMLFYELQIDFVLRLKEYYHKSKHYYLEREINYKTFTTILRQICKFNSIQINSHVRYINSNYINEYIIFIQQ
jgi:hypothetical protein